MNAPFTRKRVRSLSVACSEGACWITWQGSGDVVLRAGESIEVHEVRRFCLEVLGSGKVMVKEAAARGASASRLVIETPAVNSAAPIRSGRPIARPCVPGAPTSTRSRS